jgi:hypothetical protein
MNSKTTGVVAAKSYTRRYGNRIKPRTGVVRGNALDACLG